MAEEQITAPASVTTSKGETMSVSVSEFLPNSLMLKALPEDLEFRERVQVELFGFTFAGEVVFASNHEAAVVFETNPAVFEAIEAFEDFVHARTANDNHGDTDDLSAPTATVDIERGYDGWNALPDVDEQGRLHVHDDLERLGILLGLRAGRPQLVRADHALTRVVVTDGPPPLALIAIPAGGQGYIVPPPSEMGGLDSAIQELRGTFEQAYGAANAASEPPDADGLPTLRSDGTIEFSSRAQFEVQRQVNLDNGAVMATGPAMPLGSRRSLVLMIPGADPVHIPTAEVVFTDGDKVGFEVTELDSLKAAIAHSLAEGGTKPRRRRPSSRGRAPAKPPFSHSAPLTGLPNARAFLDFRAGAADDLSVAGGWYVGLMDRVLRSGRDALIKVSIPSDRLKIWVVGGRVVAVQRLPPPDKDRLGARLVSTRAIDTGTLDLVLQRAETEKRPIGQVILDSGSVTRTDMNRALRKQIMERTLVPCEWQSGRVEVGAWSEPPVDADLLAVRGEAITTSLLRKQLQLTRLATLREELASFHSRTAIVDLAKIYEAYRLTDREQRFYARGADARGTLTNLISMSSTRPLEGYRLALLGAALGFVTLSDAPTTRP